MVSAWLGLVARECAGAEGFTGQEAGRPDLWEEPAHFSLEWGPSRLQPLSGPQCPFSGGGGQGAGSLGSQ